MPCARFEVLAHLPASGFHLEPMGAGVDAGTPAPFDGGRTRLGA
jgi:hypothetical protein